jgi:hypothetical protein
MEWLFSAAGPVQQVLGFPDKSVLTQAVPGTTAQRSETADGQLAARGIPASEQYRIMSETLALDEILYDVARRLFLERLVCIQF